jgi:hypothetical protein
MKQKSLNQLLTSLFIMGLVIFLSQNIFAQVPTTQVLPDTSKMTYNQLSQTLGLFVYPAKDQSKQQQKVDEFDCYKWAMDQSGIDPLNPPKVEAEVKSGPTGGAVKGAAKGAAAGAAIGAIAGDAGKGAAIGAAAGGMGGFGKGQQAQAQQNQQAQANAAAQEQALKDKFKKAFSVCLEGKGYTVK